jgi:uncharacterized protein
MIPVNNHQARRFELVVDGQLAICDYRRYGSTLELPHTVVPASLQGHGIAALLVQAALDWARAEGLKVLPSCSYVASYIRRHPREQDLLA